jgi:hypothetical protein
MKRPCRSASTIEYQGRESEMDIDGEDEKGRKVISAGRESEQPRNVNARMLKSSAPMMGRAIQARHFCK